MLGKRKRIRALAAATAVAAALVVPTATSPVLATGSEGFLVLQPGFTQTLWAINPNFLGGVAFAKNGDVLTDHCAFNGSPLDDYSQTSTTLSHGSTLHNFSELTSNAGCGLANHSNGFLYTNTGGGVVQLNDATGAQTAGPFGTNGNALGIATDPVTGNLIYVGSGPAYNLLFVDAGFTTSGTFSTVDTGDFKDQITWSPDGKFLFISNRGSPFKLQILDRTGALVQNVVMAHEPDGIAFHAAAPQFVVTNDTDGTMTRFDFPGNDYSLPPAQSMFATGGFRGDMSAVGGDSCLYLTQAGTRYADGFTDGNNSVLQICGGFAPTIPDAPITAHPVTFSATEGQSFSGTVATVTDKDPNDMANEYQATIDWGDGTGTSAGTVSGPDGGPYNVSGTHTYAEEGAYHVKVHVTDSDDASNTADTVSTAKVGDALLSSRCTMPSAITPVFVGSTAEFTDSSSTGTLSDFSATIDWGDTTTSTGTIVGGPGLAPYDVNGSHNYSTTGSFTVTTTINDVGGSQTVATCHVLVAGFPTPNGGTFVIGDLEAGLGNHVTWWSSQWAKINLMSGGPAPSSMKGFAGFEDMPLPSPLPPLTKLCGMTWTTDTGNSSPPPATVPSDMLVFVSSHIVQNGSVISGDIKEVIVVHNDPGYQPDPGHTGSGTETLIVCSIP
ncbi:MAG: hypothetical protein E6I81_09795 [Chloroflexi bacterium]|nr:MAG: hypothetical protein E6I89_16295 [Chloroflexota bacterium]TMD71726.1 MAG: hypothetical protein E6I81_09795 [Chloroflexota bacterium]